MLVYRTADRSVWGTIRQIFPDSYILRVDHAT